MMLYNIHCTWITCKLNVKFSVLVVTIHTINFNTETLHSFRADRSVWSPILKAVISIYSSESWVFFMETHCVLFEVQIWSSYIIHINLFIENASDTTCFQWFCQIRNLYQEPAPPFRIIFKVLHPWNMCCLKITWIFMLIWTVHVV